MNRFAIIALGVFLGGCSEQVSAPKPAADNPSPMEAEAKSLAFGLVPHSPEDLQLRQARLDLIDELSEKPFLVSDHRVLQVIASVPREEFCLPANRHLAYRNTALPIKFGQTISQPYIVAFMTEKLEPKPDDRVLEIGTGSGYQAAVLSPLVEHVYTVEIIPELAAEAAETLERLGYDNVSVKHGNGYRGWAEHAPYDAIIVTCAPTDVPKALVDQLAEGGRMVIPVGEFKQELFVLKKTDGEIHQEKILSVLFVPMEGEE